MKNNEYIKKQNKKTCMLSNKIHINIIANIREKKYSNSSSEMNAEFLALNEFELITETYREFGFETTAYIGENEFIKHQIQESSKSKINIVVNYAQTGHFIGRKSLIPAFCQLNDIIFCGSNPYVVSLTRHKFHSDILVKKLGIRTAHSYYYSNSYGWLNNQKPVDNEYVIAKLNYEASSIGLTNENIFHYSDRYDSFIHALSIKYNQPVVVQKFIEGAEVECPQIRECRSILLPPIEIKINNNEMGTRILTFDLRNTNKYTYLEFRKENNNLVKQIQRYTSQIIDFLEMTGYCRIDYRVDKQNNCFVTDIATNPGIAEATSFFTSFSSIGLDYKDFLLFKITNTLNRNGLLKN